VVKYVVRKLKYGYLRGIKKKILYPEQFLILRRSIDKRGLNFKKKFSILSKQIKKYKNFSIRAIKATFANLLPNLTLKAFKYKNKFKNFFKISKTVLILKSLINRNFLEYYKNTKFLKHVKNTISYFLLSQRRIYEKRVEIILKKIKKIFRRRFRFYKDKIMNQLKNPKISLKIEKKQKSRLIKKLKLKIKKIKKLLRKNNKKILKFKRKLLKASYKKNKRLKLLGLTKFKFIDLKKRKIWKLSSMSKYKRKSIKKRSFINLKRNWRKKKNGKFFYLKPHQVEFYFPSRRKRGLSTYFGIPYNPYNRFRSRKKHSYIKNKRNKRFKRKKRTPRFMLKYYLRVMLRGRRKYLKNTNNDKFCKFIIKNIKKSNIRKFKIKKISFNSFEKKIKVKKKKKFKFLKLIYFLWQIKCIKLKYYSNKFKLITNKLTKNLNITSHTDININLKMRQLIEINKLKISKIWCKFFINFLYFSFFKFYNFKFISKKKIRKKKQYRLNFNPFNLNRLDKERNMHLFETQNSFFFFRFVRISKRLLDLFSPIKSFFFKDLSTKILINKNLTYYMYLNLLIKQREKSNINLIINNNTFLYNFNQKNILNKFNSLILFLLPLLAKQCRDNFYFKNNV